MEGTDGRKMSSSWGNVVNIVDEPNDMFGKVMSVPDDLIKKYFILATRIQITEIDKIVTLPNPRDQKLRLAFEITALYHGIKKAQTAQESFISQFSKGELPVDIDERKMKPGPYKLSDLLVELGMVTSKSEVRRLFDQKGIKIDQQTAVDQTIVLDGSKEFLLQVGKRKFIKIK